MVTATVKGNAITQIAADKNQAPNFGALCPKGAYLKDVFDESRRLKYPMMRTHRDEPLRRVTWDQATGYIAERFQRIIDRHGPDALAFYGSGQLDTEASYLFTKFFKGFLRTNNMDTNSRLCMSSAVVAYQQAFGADAPPTCYEDVDHADVFLLVGANMADNHPVLYNRIRKRRASHSECRTIVLDPRRTRTAAAADVHVPLAPGSDVAFLQLVAKRLIAMGRLDKRFVKKHTENFDDYRAHLEQLDETALLAQCDVHPARVQEVVYHLTRNIRLLSFYCMGANQSTHGVDNNRAVINLHLQLGQVGIPGAGPFSLTGQPNAMGGREVGYLSHQLPGYRRVTGPTHRAYLEGAWQLPPGSIQSEPGLTAIPMFQAAADGRLRALWIAATNPAVTMPDVSVAQKGLQRTELVIVQDAYLPTETTRYADVLLPAAQWGEKVGTMTNSERLVLRSQKFLTPPGEAKPDWYAVAAVAQKMGHHGFDFDTPEQIWNEFIRLTAMTPCDQAGMTNDRLRNGPLQWPCPTPNHPGTPRRYLKGKFLTDTGKARFKTIQAAPPDERHDRNYPLTLTTGRLANQWHTRTRTGNVPALVRMDPEPFIEAHPDAAAAAGLNNGDRATLIGRRGQASARIRITTNIRKGLIFMPFHWGDLYQDDTNPNTVTNPAADPESKQPELKACAVRLEPAKPKPTEVTIASQPIKTQPRPVPMESAS
jgi:ferredoxin-nitrate reductase